MEAVSNGDPLLVEAAGPSTTAERMIVLKPFVTSAFKQRVGTWLTQVECNLKGQITSG